MWCLIGQISEEGSVLVHSFFYSGFMAVSLKNHPYSRLKPCTYQFQPLSSTSDHNESTPYSLRNKNLWDLQASHQAVLVPPTPSSLVSLRCSRKLSERIPQLPTSFVSFNNAEEDFNFSKQFFQ